SISRFLRITLPLSCDVFLYPVFANAKIPRSCGAGITLSLSAPASSQGSLLLLEIRSHQPFAELSAEWNSRDVPFWQISNAYHATKASAIDMRRTLLGVDLEKAPSVYPLLVHTQTASEAATCTLRIPIMSGRFATEKLQVGKEFVEPSPEQVKR